jgi:hypothetical protein
MTSSLVRKPSLFLSCYSRIDVLAGPLVGIMETLTYQVEEPLDGLHQPRKHDGVQTGHHILISMISVSAAA